MVQTTIDQFYKVTSSNKNTANAKNIKESSNHRNQIVEKKVSCLMNVTSLIVLTLL